jgi:hypothetical protein
MLDFVITS